MWAGCQVGTKPCSKYFTRDQNKYQVYTFGKHFLKNTETREQRRKVFCKIFFYIVLLPCIIFYYFWLFPHITFLMVGSLVKLERSHHHITASNERMYE